MQEILEFVSNIYASPCVQTQRKLQENGYVRLVIQEHCLYDDEMWVHPDTIEAYVNGTRNPKWIYVYKDKYINEWSSTQTQRRYSKLCKWQLQLLSDYGYIL